MSALKAYSRVLELDPNDFRSAFEIGNVKHAMSSYAEARDAFKRSLSLLKRHPEYQKGNGAMDVPIRHSLNQSLLQHAKELIRNGYYGRAASNLVLAMTDIQRILEIDPMLSPIWNLLGRTVFAWTLVREYLHLITDWGMISNLMSMAERAVAGSKSATAFDDFGKVELQTSKGTLGNLLDLASKAFKAALVTSNSLKSQSAASSWFAMSTCFFSAYSLREENEDNASKTMVNEAIRCLRMALAIDSRNSHMWNVLGVVTAVLYPRISQAAFFRSIDCDGNVGRMT